MPRLCSSLLLLLLIASPVSGVTIDWVTIGNPGNPSDTEVMIDGTTGYGAVPYIYRISKYEITNAQYAEFLNAVADTDTHSLYNPNMGNAAPSNTGRGGITRIGSSGSYTYSVIAGRGNQPVNWVSFLDSLRFANWMHNGQPTGPQGPTTTEHGAYTFSGTNFVGTRLLGAQVFVPSDNEWYKAAYYSPTGVYFDYPVGSNTQTICAAPSGVTNTANCDGGSLFPNDDITDGDVDNLTNVGVFTGSSSPYGTFDQGGNVFELTETRDLDGSANMRGGTFSELAIALRASTRTGVSFFGDGPGIGFRLAMIPEPSTGLLVIAGLLGFAVSHRRRNSMRARRA